MSNLIDLLWNDAREALYITKEEFVQNLQGWTIEPVSIDGRVAFITLTNGPQFHFQTLRSGQRISMKMIRTFLQKIIDEHGYAETRTPKEDTRQRRFNERFGFKIVGDDEYDVVYRIDGLRNAE